MEKIGLFYGSRTIKTAAVAKKIQKAFGEKAIDIIDIESAWIDDFKAYNNIIIGSSTWFDGELPVYLDELVPALQSIDMKGKKIAIFGLGDQVSYPDNFADSVGILAQIFESAGATLCGFTSPEDYNFAKSQSLRNDMFLGLVIDVENQSSKTDKRVFDWVEKLKKEFA